MFEDLLELIAESQIRFSGGQKFGQVVFMGGGGGSGKGFAWNNFMQGENFKVFNVDDFKQKFIDAGKRGMPGFERYANMDLKNPNDVGALHQYVKDSGISDHQLHSFFRAHSDGSRERLPNICFDMTLKDNKDMDEYIPKLIKMGYDPSNIHLVWILTNYREAVANNAKRDRKVPENILLQTHEGAALNMMKNFRGGLPEGLNGKIVVIVNNAQNTKWADKKSNTNSFLGSLRDDHRHADPLMRNRNAAIEAAAIKARKERLVPDRKNTFKYLILKHEGEPFHFMHAKVGIVNRWVRQNAPQTTKTSTLWPPTKERE